MDNFTKARLPDPSFMRNINTFPLGEMLPEAQ